MSHSSSTEHRDYRLTGPEAARAAEKGLVSASWYQCPISRKRLKELRALLRLLHGGVTGRPDRLPALSQQRDGAA